MIECICYLIIHIYPTSFKSIMHGNFVICTCYNQCSHDSSPCSAGPELCLSFSASFPFSSTFQGGLISCWASLRCFCEALKSQLCPKGWLISSVSFEGEGTLKACFISAGEFHSIQESSRSRHPWHHRSNGTNAIPSNLLAQPFPQTRRSCLCFHKHREWMSHNYPVCSILKMRVLLLETRKNRAY